MPHQREGRAHHRANFREDNQHHEPCRICLSASKAEPSGSEPSRVVPIGSELFRAVPSCSELFRAVPRRAAGGAAAPPGAALPARPWRSPPAFRRCSAAPRRCRRRAGSGSASSGGESERRAGLGWDGAGWSSAGPGGGGTAVPPRRPSLPLPCSEQQQYPEETVNIAKAAFTAGVVGWLYGGLPAFVSARKAFIESSRGEIFQSRADAVVRAGCAGERRARPGCGGPGASALAGPCWELPLEGPCGSTQGGPVFVERVCLPCSGTESLVGVCEGVRPARSAPAVPRLPELRSASLQRKLATKFTVLLSH